MYLPGFWTYWERQPHNKAYLLEWLKRIPGIFEETSDLVIEARLRAYLWEHCYWTGQQGPDCPFVDSPVNLAQWQDAHANDNDGRGPTWGCAPLAAFYCGLMGVLRQSVREVVLCSAQDGQVDNICEHWSDRYPRWRMVCVHTNTHWEINKWPLSALEWAKDDRLYRKAVAVSPTGGNGRWTDTWLKNGHRGMAGRVAVHRGNWPFAGGNDTLQPQHWDRLEVLPAYGAVIHQEHIVPCGSFEERSITNPPDHILA